jgi:signal transduction histidine kinase
VILSVICNDARGLLVVTLLAPLTYGYFAFSSATELPPAVYLRLPFPFVISLFYGYFAQVERLRRVSRERHEQVKKQQRIAEETRRQRERLEVLNEWSRSAASITDPAKILDFFLERALIHLPYAAALVRLRNPQSQMLETVAMKGIQGKELHRANDALALLDRVVEDPAPMIVRNVFADSHIRNREFFEDEGLVSFIGLPLLANDEVCGSFVFLAREEREFGDDEIGFLSTLAAQAAIAMDYSRLLAQSRQQAERLRGANKIKDEFLKTVSNELKSPLNVVLGYTDMFRDGLLGTLTPIQEKAIETMTRHARELQRLIEGVLQVSHVEAESLRAEIHEINIWEFLSEIRLVYDQPLEKNVKIVWDCPSDLPVVQGDRGKLKQILVNLIDNAIKFTERGTITASLRYSVSKKILEIRIADTGIGIPSDQISVIFDRFHQAHDVQSRGHQGGVGLGLYIVKKYAEFLGGTVEVESRAGAGSIFVVRIPALPQKSPLAREQLQPLARSESL